MGELFKFFNIQVAVHVFIQLRELTDQQILKLRNFLVEVLLLALLHTVNEIIELKCLLVVDTHDLIASGLKNFANTSQRSLNFDVEVEFGAVMLAASLHFPNLEFGTIKTRSHNKANAGVTFCTLSSQQVAGLFELNNGRKTRLGFGMGLKVLRNLVLLNIPHLNFSFLSSNTKEIFVNLE